MCGVAGAYQQADGKELVTAMAERLAHRGPDASGIVENEVCPVFSARAAGPLEPAPDEVMEHAWVVQADLERAVGLAPWAFSPWLVLQLPRLAGATTRGSAA